jgi:hypothetical protein
MEAATVTAEQASSILAIVAAKAASVAVPPTDESVTARRVACMVARFMHTNYPALADEPASHIKRDVTMHYARKAIQSMPSLPPLPRITPLAERPLGMVDPLLLSPPTYRFKSNHKPTSSFVIDLDKQAGKVVAFRYADNVGALDVNKAREELDLCPPYYTESHSMLTAISHCVVRERSMVEEGKRQALWARKYHQQRIGVPTTGIALLRQSTVRASVANPFAPVPLTVVNDVDQGAPLCSAAATVTAAVNTLACAASAQPQEAPRVHVHAESVRKALAALAIAVNPAPLSSKSGPPLRFPSQALRRASQRARDKRKAKFDHRKGSKPKRAQLTVVVE